eukprot:TRINITY_DN26528_c0_g1_i2.p1 TRINITY_DN26528_c0_g1~~TRINITY_DN26528_c0_g1_i2.p1  ORF type:complete len:111 (+),score=16.55 TRINITY_DN26528_c0_g1_i2:13-345(+)
MIRRPPRSTQSRSSAASDVYKRQAASTHIGASIGRVRKRAQETKLKKVYLKDPIKIPIARRKALKSNPAANDNFRGEPSFWVENINRVYSKVSGIATKKYMAIIQAKLSE